MKKNKYTIVMFLGILFMLLLFVLFFLNKEGLTNDCDLYKNLGPVGKSDDEIRRAKDKPAYKGQFQAMFAASAKKITGNEVKFDDASYKFWSDNYLTVFEIQTYIDTGKFPLNKYIISELKNNNKIKLDAPWNKDNVNNLVGNRYIFQVLIMPTMTKPEEQSAAYKEALSVFEGKTKECDPVAASTNQNTEYTTIHTTNYNQLQNICTDIVMKN